MITSRNLSQTLKCCSSPIQQKFKTIRFRIPATEPKRKQKTVVSDPDLTWNAMKSIVSIKYGKNVNISNLEERRVLRAFKLPSNDPLPIPRPPIRPTPFEYHSNVNEDASYVQQPRLSVTKLLTSGWCDLRTFYEIYAGLRKVVSKRLFTGTAHHEKLEKKAHPALDSEALEQEIDKASVLLTKDEKKMLFSSKMASKLASEWSEKVVTRLLEMCSTKKLREIQIHGYLSFDKKDLATNVDDIHGSILVNGVVDIVSLDKANHTAEEPLQEKGHVQTKQHAIDLDDSHNTERSSLPDEILDLRIEIPKAKATLTALAKDHHFHVTDVKTRAFDSIPTQLSVIFSARDQCLIYGQLLFNISRDSHFAYESTLENARRRNVNPDEPISVGYAIELLVKQFNTLALDYMRIAKGEDIGFAGYDSIATSEPETKYSLSQFLSEEQLKTMLADLYGPESSYLEMDLSILFKTWAKPLTLRYFAARAAQAYNMFEAFEPGSVNVEYHKVNSTKLLARIQYAFDQQLLKDTLERAASFWNGERLPEGVKHRSRCNNCVFRNRCPVKNEIHKQSFVEEIYKLYE